MNTILRCAAAIVALVLVASPGAARTQEPRRITLDEALALFGQNSIELRMARADAAEAAALARQAGAFPNPALTATHEPLSGDGRSSSETYVHLSQRLEWSGGRAARHDAARRLADAARARFDADSMRLAFDVKVAYASAVRAEEALRVLSRVIAVFRDGERHAQAQYDEQDISLYELRRLRLERTRYETRLADAELVAAAARRALAQLIAPHLELAPADTSSALSLRPAPDADLVLLAITKRPEMRAALAALASQRASAAFARRQRVPEVSATGGYKRQSDGLSGLFIGLSLPLPLWDRRSGAIDAADAGVRAAEAKADLTRRQIESEVRSALDAYRSLLRRATLRATPDGDATDILDIARVAYADGEMELVELLDAAEALCDAQLAEAQLRAALRTAWHALERAAGGDPNPREDS